jgi:DNA-binding MarR family transcriptional regulator
MNLSLPSVSQMIERLVKQGLVRRSEDSEDRRRKTIEVTAKARTFLARLKDVRSAEFTAGTEALSPATRRRLLDVLAQALKELSASPRDEGDG